MDVQSEVNPYQSPATDTGGPQTSVANEGASRRIYFAWCAVFVLNLAVPLLFGWSLTERGGRVGMLVATAALFVVGSWLCASARRIAQALVTGGVAVGLGQVVPVVQIMAGSAGFHVVAAMGLEDAAVDLRGLTNEPSGFIVTTTTGGLLMAIAIVVGLAARALFSARWRR